jgi:RNA polymerase sigma-54 factor
MQQAIMLLQVPLLELQQTLRQELNQNPLLEESQEIIDDSIEIEDLEEGFKLDNATSLSRKEEQTEPKVSDSDIHIVEDILKFRESWREYTKYNTEGPYTKEDEEKRLFMETCLTRPKTLQTSLLEQLHLSSETDEEYIIGEEIIGNINDKGYLEIPLKEIAIKLGKTEDETQEVLNLIQTFEPIGVGARDLKECLLIQMKNRPKKNPLAEKIVAELLDELQRKKFSKIADILKTTEEEVKKASEFISTFNPKPGTKLDNFVPQYIYPDVIVNKVGKKYEIIINERGIPPLKISSAYKKLIEQKEAKAQRYIRKKLRAALWFIRTIQQRKNTIYEVAKCIVDTQKEFLDKGIEYFKPLRVKDIAKSIGKHESTVSRVTSNKYIKTPQGIFELKYFFSTGFKTEDNEVVSSRSIKDKIKKIIAEENPHHPFSDQDIVKILLQEGFQIARRTVAKYREDLKILSFNLRKK